MAKSKIITSIGTFSSSDPIHVEPGLVVTGSLTASAIFADFVEVSSSVVFTSGSNIFGDDPTDTHEFSGSVSMSNSLFVNENVGIGTTTPGDKFHVASSVAPTDATLLLELAVNATSPPAITFRKSRGTLESPLIVNTAGGDVLGQINFSGYDGSLHRYGASISAVSVATPSGYIDMPAELVFKTSKDGSSTPTQRMVIDKDGKVGIGTESPDKTLSVGGNAIFGQDVTTGFSYIYVGEEATSDSCLVIGYDHDNNWGGFCIGGDSLGTAGISIANGGNVGIGTATPTALLSIREPANDSPAAINFQSDASSLYWIGMEEDEGASKLYFGRGGTWASAVAYKELVIHSSKVGIGTAAPSQALTVEGNISCSGDIRIGNDDSACTPILTVSDGAWGQIKTKHIDNTTDTLYIQHYSAQAVVMNGGGGQTIFNGKVGIMGKSTYTITDNHPPGRPVLLEVMSGSIRASAEPHGGNSSKTIAVEMNAQSNSLGTDAGEINFIRWTGSGSAYYNAAIRQEHRYNVGTSLYGLGFYTDRHPSVEAADPEETRLTSKTLRMIIDGDGDVGIGVADPDQKLEVNGKIHQHPGGNGVTLNYWYSSYIEYVPDSGGARGVTHWASSERFKDNIRDLEIDSSKIYDLRPVNFEWNDTQGELSGSTSFGLIAEEVVEVLPELVAVDSGSQPFMVDYGVLSVLLLNELQKKNTEIDDIKSRLEVLEQHMSSSNSNG